MTHENEEEIDFNDFVDKIFFEEPKQPKSICINCNKNNVTDLFSKLLRIFVEGVRIMGSNTSLAKTGDILYNFTTTDIIKLQKYFISLGYKLNYKITHRNIVLKLKSFICNNSDWKFKDSDIQNYKNLYPSQIFISDLIHHSTIKTTKLHEKKTYFTCKDLYFFINFESI